MVAEHTKHGQKDNDSTTGSDEFLRESMDQISADTDWIIKPKTGDLLNWKQMHSVRQNISSSRKKEKIVKEKWITKRAYAGELILTKEVHKLEAWLKNK